MKRERDDRTQADLDATVISAILNNDVKAKQIITKAIEDGANPNMHVYQDVTLLMAVSQMFHTGDLARYLISKGAFCDLQTADGRTALHFATNKGRRSTVEVLLEARARVDHPDVEGFTPLHRACARNDGLGIAELLIVYRAPVDAITRKGMRPIHVACHLGTADMVRLLLDHGASLKDTVPDACSIICCAIRNKQYHAEVLHELVARGVNLKIPCPNHKYGHVHTAMKEGTAQLRVLANLFPPNNSLKDRCPQGTHPDPVGAYRVGRHFGIDVPGPNAVIAFVDAATWPAKFCWAVNRIHSARPADAVDILSRYTDNRSLSHIVVAEAQGMVRDPTTRDTLFHVAARTGNMDALKALMRRYANPLLRNAADRTPLQEAANAQVRALICEYAVFRPDFWHADWYGPYFCMRARAFLLVAQRWRDTRVRSLSRDIVFCILQWVAHFEEV